MENKIVAIEVGLGVDTSKCVKKDGFTTNVNYVGHYNGTPVYINKKLNNGETKQIMNNEEYKVLKEGKYLAKVEQVIRKHGKDANGNEDTSKDIISIELNVKGEDNFHYLTFCVNGYGELQTKYANEDIEKIIEEFDLDVIEDLKDKIVVLSVKMNDKGYTNMYINPQREFFDWGNLIKFDGEAKFNCVVKKFYKQKIGNKYTFVVQAVVDGKDIEEFITYDLDNEFRRQSFDWVITKLGLNVESDVGTDLAEKTALLIVKRVSKGDKVFFNKRIGFEKKAPRKPSKW